MSQMHVRRGDAEHDEGPAYATRYPCPVDDCDWYLDVERPALLPLEMVEMFGDGPHVWATQVAAVEQTLQAHLDEHTVVEFVTTITRLRALLGTDTTPDRLAWIDAAAETAAAEQQARYQETACARRPAEERPDA